jgi:HSF-type DNA-binding
MKSDFSLDRNNTKYEAAAFPLKLHVMLEDAKTFGFEKCIAWNSDGLSLQIHDAAEFTNKIMPLYFKQSKFKSFQRQ